MKHIHAILCQAAISGSSPDQQEQLVAEALHALWEDLCARSPEELPPMLQVAVTERIGDIVTGIMPQVRPQLLNISLLIHDKQKDAALQVALRVLDTTLLSSLLAGLKDKR